jgi:hypothetical protein
LFREVDGVLEELGPVAVAPEGVVNHEVFQENDEPAFRRADGEEKVDHAHDGPVAAQDENPAPVRLLEDEAKTLELFLFVRAEVLLFAEQLSEKVRQLVQVFEYGRLDNDFAHGVAPLFHKEGGVAMRDVSS